MINCNELNQAATFQPATSHTRAVLCIGGADVCVGWEDGVLQILIGLDTGEVPADLITDKAAAPVKILIDGVTVFEAN